MKAKIDDTSAFGISHHDHSKHRVFVDGLSHTQALKLKREINNVLIINKEFNERYPMCEDQPAQIDCRNTECLYHINGKCKNISPAITLVKGSATCWSYCCADQKP